MTSKEIIKILKGNGFEEIRRAGSHVLFKNHQTQRTTTVPVHGNRDLPIGTEKAILKQAGLN